MVRRSRKAEAVLPPDPRQLAFRFFAEAPPSFVTVTRRDGYVERVRTDRLRDWIEKNIVGTPAKT